MDERSKKILDRLERLCAGCEYCTSDIRRKITAALRKSFGEDAEGLSERADEILASLLADKYVDDARYASAFVREKSSLSGWGPVKIRFALASKHISDAVITEALKDIDCGKAEEKLLRSLEVRWRSLTGPDGQIPQDAKLKLIKFALSRGYEYDAVRSAVELVTGSSRERR